MIHTISLHDLEFARIPVPFASERGVAQTRWVRVGMPLIPNNVVHGTFYLYRSREDALAGKKPAGSGFIVRHDGEPSPYVFGNRGVQHYAVTNWHVACEEGASVIRLNTKDGGTDVVELGPEDWHFLPGKYDIAVAPLTIDEKVHVASAISTQSFFQPIPNWGRDHMVGVGDDVFMIGLFVDHDGLTTNIPSARFGNISMLPNPRATIRQPTGYDGESFVIDMHSRTGFSGSPVYVYRTFAADLNGSHFGYEVEVFGVRHTSGDRYKGRVRLPHTLFALLGIHWGQFPEKWELKERVKLREVRKDLIVEGAYVEGMSGMTCVIPAMCIWEVLEMPSLTGPREEAQKAASAALVAKGELQPGVKVVRKESIPSEPEAANPDHAEDFTRLLTAAVTKKPPDA